MIYPVPAKISARGVYRVTDTLLDISGDENAFASNFFEGYGYQIKKGAKTFITLKMRNNRELTYNESSRTFSREKFSIVTELIGDRVHITVEYAYKNGLFYALNRVLRGLNGELIIGEIEDYPQFAKRGYLEGFYGKPWDEQRRIEMIMLMASYGMNTYYYAPKDDLYHRSAWRELYPEKELGMLSRVVQVCCDNYVDFNYCIAPGLSICYSSEDDYNLLLRKVNQLYSLGARGFGLLLDDIPEKLFFEEDIRRFDYETVNAHIYLANRLYDDLKKIDQNIHMTLCPLVYHGKGDEYYISKLGQGIEPDIDLFWTGEDICSKELTVQQAAVFKNSTNHRPLYWDNFPVNDAEMYNEMHFGYIDGRENELFRYSRGIIANTMEYALSSKTPLLTIAGYLWNPRAYNGRESWKYALDLVLDGRGNEFELFADNLFSSCLKSENSSIFNRMITEVQQQFYAGNMSAAVGALTEYLDKLGACCELIKKPDPLFDELRPWIKKQCLAYEILRLCADAMRGECKKEKLSALLSQYTEDARVLYDFSFQSFVQEVLKLA